MYEPVAAYPDVVYVVEPVPSWTRILELPFPETLLNITVIRLTHDGMPVKSMLVPEVDATAVPETMLELRPLTATVPVPAGRVSVPFVAVLGSCRVTLPPPEELSFRLMTYS